MLRLYFFGAPRIERDGQVVALRRTKALALLAYLALSRLPQERDRRLRAERVALEVHAEDLVPALGGGVLHRVIEPHAGVVDEDVEPAEALRRLPHERRGLVLVLHVRFHEHDIAAHARRQVHLRDGRVAQDFMTEGTN